MPSCLDFYTTRRLVRAVVRHNQHCGDKEHADLAFKQETGSSIDCDQTFLSLLNPLIQHGQLAELFLEYLDAVYDNRDCAHIAALKNRYSVLVKLTLNKAENDAIFDVVTPKCISGNTTN